MVNMYPLFHCRAAMKPCSASRPTFDPLAVDPLVVVVLDDGDAFLDLEDGEFFLEQMEQGIQIDIGDGPLVQNLDLAMVEVVASNPLNVLR
ncbi:hypothetical protein AMTR_s00020p00075360 [Amborella trichopoda]|uniref:Uncharacterized protein n=1 Tax=Amborella trichopoda TaxID=13333 RepID=W1PVU9_AMBTC|nr:hypothetical protein AMTR_s00020p00075360 [Amborella trichopoda]